MARSMTADDPETARWVWELTPTERLVVKTLQHADGPLSREEIRSRAWSSIRSVDGALSSLIEDDRVERVAGGGEGCRWRYTLA